MPTLPLNSSQMIQLAHLISGKTTPDSIPTDRWAELIELSLDDGVGDMLLWSIRQSDWSVPDLPEWIHLVDSVRHHGVRSMLLEKIRWQVATAFDLAKIPAIWLKGIALAHTHYPEPYLRPMADLDVLVPVSQMALARDSLKAQYFLPAEIDFFELAKFTDQARHHECFLDQSGRVKLDLHFRLLVPSILGQLDERDMDWFWTQTNELTIGKPSFSILKPEANLLYLCAHTFLQNHGEPLDLLHLLDMHLMLTHSSLNWDLIEKQAHILGWVGIVRQAVSILPPLFGTQLPENIPVSLLSITTDIDQQLFSLDPLYSTRRWDEWRFAYSRMSVAQKIRLIWLTLFPPTSYMRKQYQMSSNQHLLPYYVKHFFDGAKEIIRSVLSFHKAPHHTP